jgi:hypothetical protein
MPTRALEPMDKANGLLVGSALTVCSCVNMNRAHTQTELADVDTRGPLFGCGVRARRAKRPGLFPEQLMQSCEDEAAPTDLRRHLSIFLSAVRTRCRRTSPQCALFGSFDLEWDRLRA